MDLSIIIVNYKNSHSLKKCLCSIYQTLNNLEFEVLVIDNNSLDKGLDALEVEFPQVEFMRNKTNEGFAKANNRAAEFSKGAILLFLNPDTQLTDAAITSMHTHLMENPEIGVLGPKILNNDGSLQYSCRSFPSLWTGLFNRYSILSLLFPGNLFTKRYLMTDYDHQETRNVDWVSGCCMMLRFSTFKTVGGFDGHYFIFNEDVDLCKVLQDQGYRVVYFPHARVFHDIGSSNRKVPFFITLKRHQGMNYYFQKHHSVNPLFKYLIQSMVALRCLSQLFINLLKRKHT